MIDSAPHLGRSRRVHVSMQYSLGKPSRPPFPRACPIGSTSSHWSAPLRPAMSARSPRLSPRSRTSRSPTPRLSFATTIWPRTPRRKRSSTRIARSRSLREPAAFPSWFRRIVFKHCDRITRRKEHELAPLAVALEVASHQTVRARHARGARDTARPLHCHRHAQRRRTARRAPLLHG